MLKMRVAVLASGGGSNLQQLLDRFPDREDSPEGARVCLVLADRPGIGALERAARAGVTSAVVAPRDFENSLGFGEKILEHCRSAAIDLVVLAGFLKKIPDNVVAAFNNRIINIHPALLPSFGGAGMYGHYVHEAVINSGVKVTGCSVHFVNEQYDRGPIIAQRCVPVYHDDTPEVLAARVLREEHRLLPEVVDLLASGRVHLNGRVVEIDKSNEPD